MLGIYPIMPAIRQTLQLSDRLDKYVEWIGKRLSEQPFAPPYIHRGKNFNVSAIIGTGLMRWVEEIEGGKVVPDDRIKTYLVEYLYLTYVDQSRITQVYINAQVSDLLDVVAAYLVKHHSHIPLLESVNLKKINNRLLIVLTLMKLADDLGYKFPKLLPPSPSGGK